MSPAVEIFVIVAAGLVSGFVNTLASSGSAVTLPLMIFRGLPATVANGTNRVPLLTAAVFVPIGVWAGFIVLDSATYMLLGLVVVVGYDLIRANAIKSLFLLWISLASLLVFYVEGEVDWRIGVWLSAGSILGS